MPSTTSQTKSAGLKIPAQLTELGQVRDYVTAKVVAAVEPSPQRNEAVAELELAVTELVSNVIRHGFKDKESGELHVDAVVEINELQVTITHDGAPFDCDHDSVDPILEPLEGGMGLFLVQQCLDSVCYEQLPDGRNQIHIRKTLAAE